MFFVEIIDSVIYNNFATKVVGCVPLKPLTLVRR